MVALGAERTIEQDPAFAIRIMVDIADRALSRGGQRSDHGGPGDQPSRRRAATDRHGRPLASRRGAAADGRRAGFVIPVRVWEDYLTLGTTEIREYGAHIDPGHAPDAGDARGVARGGRSEHRAAVEDELARLDATVARSYGDSVDFDRASSRRQSGDRRTRRLAHAVSLTGSVVGARRRSGARSGRRLALEHPPPARSARRGRARRADDRLGRERQLDRARR